MSSTLPPVLPARSSRFSEIDALRAVACGLVVWNHAVELFSGVASNREWAGLSKQIGWLGVLIFFAISGFVIPSSLRGERWVGVKRFASRRFWRLYPPFWCAVLITWLIDPWEKTMKSIPWRASMLPVNHWEAIGIGVHFWTLQVELMFYIIVGFLFLIFGRLSLRVILPTYLGINAILWIWICFEWPYLQPTALFWLGFPIYLSAMFWGACCRELINDKPSARVSLMLSISRRAVGIGLVTGLLSMIPLSVSCLALVEGDALMLKEGVTTFGGIMIVLIFGILVPVKVEWLACVGRWTYSTYLLHMAVLHFGLRTINSQMLAGFSTVLRGWPLPVYEIVLIVLCFVVGVVGYRWIEQPSDRIGKRLVARKSHRD